MDTAKTVEDLAESGRNFHSLDHKLYVALTGVISGTRKTQLDQRETAVWKTSQKNSDRKTGC